jgi:DNA-binding NtrC family response regulator
MARVLLVDDEMTLVQMVSEVLRSEGHQVIPFTNGTAALDAISNIIPELILANLCSERSRATGLSLIQKARTLSPPAVAVMITASGSQEAAVEALRKGAYDCLDRPFTLDELKLRIQRALSYHSALSENVFLRRQLQSKFQFREIVGTSTEMLDLLKIVERVADTESSILICGPAGTGKELVARAIHFNSRRRFAPFLNVSCALSPESVLETQLFGCKKGSIGSQTQETAGALEEASGGTVLLDQVGALSLSLQTRLVRALQDREVRRVGDDFATKIDVRVLAATDELLERKVAAGAFREDLYRGLSVVAIQLPALRDRAEDVPLLISHFLEGKVHRSTGQPFSITPEAVEACCRYEWPGNVRELEHAIGRACVVSKDNAIKLCDLPGVVQRLSAAIQPKKVPAGALDSADAALVPCANGAHDNHAVTQFAGLDANGQPFELVPLKRFLRGQELNYLHRILAQVGGSKERAAELLGISLATIYRKLSETEPDQD